MDTLRSYSTFLLYFNLPNTIPVSSSSNCFSLITAPCYFRMKVFETEQEGEISAGKVIYYTRSLHWSGLLARGDLASNFDSAGYRVHSV